MDAVRLLNKRLSEKGQHRIDPRAEERVRFEDLLKMHQTDYQINNRKSGRRAGMTSKILTRFFADYRAVDITTDKIMEFIRERQDAGIKPATISYDLAVLKRMFTLAIRAERLRTKPYIPSIKFDNVRKGFFSESQFKAVIQHLPDDVRVVVECLWLTGWRRMEVQTLTWAQIDWEQKVIRLDPGSSKNGEGRIFPFGLYPELEDLIARQKRYTESVESAKGEIVPWIFHRDGVAIRDFRDTWNNACKKENLDGRWVHDIRRSAVRRMEMSGLPRSLAMRLTGHKTESIYRRYAVFSQKDLEQGVGQLASFHEKPEPKKVVNFADSLKSIKVLLK